MSEADNGRSEPQTAVLHPFLDRWLTQAPAPLVAAARLAAIPQRFDTAFLSQLQGADTFSLVTVQQLEQIGFLTHDTDERYQLEPSIREYFIQEWQQTNPAAYRRAHAQAVDYLEELITEETRLVLAYHQLGADDERGVAALTAVCEAAWRTGHLGLAERLLHGAAEHMPILGKVAQTWLHYWQARLHLSQQQLQAAEATLATINIQEAPPDLAARLHLVHGALFAATQRWSAALTAYQQAQSASQTAGDSLRTAQALEQQGNIFLALATYFGGLSPNPLQTPSRLRYWLYGLIQAPFLLYRWFSRRLVWLPTLYFGLDYQDWIVASFLLRTRRYWRQAQQSLPNQPDLDHTKTATLQLDLRIQLADLHHQLGQWRLAEAEFARLQAALPPELDSYRQATLLLAEGRAALARSQEQVAGEKLAIAYDIFQRYGNRQAQAVVAALRGDAAVGLGERETAVSHYTNSTQTAYTVGDLLTVTHAWSRLLPLSPDPPEAANPMPPQHGFIARFPGTIWHRFQRVAVYVALPAAYLFFRLLLLIINIIASTIEIPIQTQAISGLLLFSSLGLVTIWGFLFIYMLLGWRIVHKQTAQILQHQQPQYVVTATNNLCSRDEQGQTTNLPWEEIKTVALLNWRWHHTPIALFSSTLVATTNNKIMLPGITSHYPLLQQEITQQIIVKRQNMPQRAYLFTLLNGRWFLITIIITLLITAIALFGLLDEPTLISVELPDGTFYRLYVTSFLYQFTNWFATLFPLVTGARLLHHRANLRRLGLPQLAPWLERPLWAALIIFIILAVIGLIGLRA